MSIRRWTAILLVSLAHTSVAAAQGALDRYELDDKKPSQMRLAKELAEVSGLALTADERLFTHGDERARVYELDPGSGKVIAEFDVGDPPISGDFEGIAAVDDRLFLVTSGGTLFEFNVGANGNQVPFRGIPTGLGERCEVEGLTYDAASEALLLACKTTNGGETGDHLVVWAFGLARMSLESSPRFSISLDDLAPFELPAKLHPSGLDLHPITGTLFVIAAQEETIVELSSSGEIIGAHRFRRKHHPQPEGIAFAPDGTLLITDEGSKRGTLTRYRYKQ